MNNFSLKLAWRNIRSNQQLYLPYFLSSVLTIAMFQMMSSLMTNDFVLERSSILPMLFGLGTGVIAIFSVIFIFYTNSFLIKRRKKELGLYNILGLEKKHISRILAVESLIVGGASIVVGILTGVLFGQLAFMFLNYLLRLPVAFDYSFTWGSILMTAALFSGIFFMILLYNMAQVQFSNPIQLLKGSNTGEKEPKSSPILFVIGLVSLFAGYWISLTITDPISALTQFFLAVLLVIVGTYFLFTAGSIIILKALKKNKNFYYQPGPFISVSGMLYRMKQHAIGLANISILSVMVIVAVATTVTLYAGTEETLNNRFPEENNASVRTEFGMTGEELDESATELMDHITRLTNDEGLEIQKNIVFKNINLFGYVENNAFVVKQFEPGGKMPTMLMMLTLEDYNREANQTEMLEEDEAFIRTSGDKMDVKADSEYFELGDQTFKTKELTALPFFLDQNVNLVDTLIVVLPDTETIDEIAAYYNPEKNPYLTNWELSIFWDTNATEDEKQAYAEKMEQSIGDHGQNVGVFYESRSGNRQEWYSMNGGFLFLGIFLGGLFTIGTVLITYFKQVSEGYDDRERIQIMQKVGLDKETTREATRNQLLWMFTLPILTAVIHTAFAYPIIQKMLILFGITSHKLLILCTVGVVVAFSLIYWVIYRITSRVYLRIVE